MSGRVNIKLTRTEASKVASAWACLEELCYKLVTEGASKRLDPDELLREAYLAARRTAPDAAPRMAWARFVVINRVRAVITGQGEGELHLVATGELWYLLATALASLIAHEAGRLDVSHPSLVGKLSSGCAAYHDARERWLAETIRKNS